MKLVILTAVLAVCGAARIHRSYVPAIASRTTAGSSGTLTSLEGSSRDGVPTGGYTNDALGVVVDAAAPGTRTAGAEPTGLGGPRTSYGSSDSKVGDAAFRATLPSFGGPGGANTRIAPGFEAITGEKENTGGSSTRIAPGFESVLAFGSDNDKAHANTLKFSNEIGLDKYSYGFQTDNGIAIGENGVSKDGVKANGGYSYKGDDGKVYSVSYTADKNGYKPQGSHLPTPPPIPQEILVSLEKNAEEEAAGVVDDGSYDAQKYNNEGDYTSNNAGNNNNGPTTSSGGASIGTSFGGHSNQASSPVSPTGFSTGNSAYSSAVTTGSGSASAYAATGPSHTSPKNQYTHTYGFNPHGTGSSSVSNPSSATASASVSGKQPYFGANSFPTRFGGNQNTFGQSSGANVQSQTQSGSFNLFETGQYSPTNVPATEINKPLESNEQYKPQTSQGSFGQIGSNNANFASNSLKPTHSSLLPSNQATGSSTVENSGQYSHNYQPNVGTINKPGHSNAAVVTTVSPIASAQSGQYQGTTTSSQYNGLTQATVSPFPLGSSTPSTQYQSQSSNFGHSSNQAQFGSFGSQQVVHNPTVQSQSGYSQTGNTQTQSQQGTVYEYNKPASVNQQTVTQFGQKPIEQTQSGYSQTGNTQTQSQQGTIYEYNKPTPVNQQTVTQSSQKPIVHTQSGHSQTGNTQTQSQQGTIYEYNKPTSVNQQTETQFGQKPIVQNQSGYSQTGNTQTQSQQGTIYEYNKPAAVTQQTVTQFGQKPFVQTQSGFSQTGNTQIQSQQGSNYQYNKPASVNQQTVTQFGQKPIVQAQSGYSESGSTQTQAQQGTIYQYNKPTSFNQPTVTQFVQKPLVQSQASLGQSQTQSQQGTIYEYNKPTTSTVEQVTSSQAPFVSQSTQFGNQASNNFGSISQHSTSQQTQNQGIAFNSQPASNSGQVQGSVTTSSTQTQFVQPIASSQTGSTFQTQSGNQGSQFVQENQGTIYEYNKPVNALSQTNSNSASTGSQIVQGTSFQSGVAQVQNTQSSNKPTGISQTSSTFKPSEYDSQQASLFAQKVTETASGQQSSGASLTSFPTRFGEKPSGGSISQSQTSQYGQQVGSSQTGSNYQQTQFGSSFGHKPSTQIQTSFGQQPTSNTQSGYNYQQTAFGTTTGSKFGQKPQTVFTSSTSSKGQSTQFGQQNIGSASATQFGNQQGSQFSQNTQTVQNTGLTSGTFSQTTTPKPVGSSQTGSYFQHIGQKPQTSQGSSFTIAPSKGQSSQTSQFGQTQYAGSGFTQSQHGSSTGYKPQSGFGTVSTTASQVQPISQYGNKPVGSQFSQNTFQQTPTTGSQFGQKLPSSAGTVFTTSQVQSNYQFNKTPFGSQSTQNTFQPTQFGSITGSQFGQTNGAVSQTTSFGQKPTGGSFGSSGSQANKGSSFSIGTTQSGVKPFGSSQTPGSKYSQTHYGSLFASQNNQSKPSGFGTVSTVAPQVIPISQYGPKPSGLQYTQNSFTQTQYGSVGSRFGENQVTSGIVPVTTTSFVQKPVGVSQTATGYEQTQLGSSSSSVIPTKGQSVQTTQIGVKPFGSSQTSGSSFTHNQFGAFGVQKGQNSQSGVNSFSTTTQAPQYQGTQFGSSLSSQTNKGNSFSIGTPSKGQTTQSAIKPFGSGYTQTQYGSSFASQNSQNTQSGVGAVSSSSPQVIPISQYGQKPFGSQSSQNTFTQTQYGSSQFGQNHQTVHEHEPVAVSQTGSGYQQTQSGSSSSSVANTGAVTNQGQVVQTTQYGVKPSQNAGSSYTQFQFGTQGAQKVNQQSGDNTFSTTTQSPQYQGSQFGVSTGSQSGQTQLNQKPFGSTQNTGSGFQQTQTGSQFGSNFNVKPQATFGTQSSSSVFGQASQTQFGQVKKPYNTPFNTQFGVIGQKPQASASAFASSSPSFGSSQVNQISKYQTTQFGTSGTQAANTFGGSQAVQGQTTQTSSQFGAQAQKPLGSTQFNYQQSQFTGIKKPVGSQSTFQYGQSTPSTVGSISLIPSKEQNAFSTVSRFGEQSKIVDQHTYQSTVAPLEYSTTFASTERYGSSTPSSFFSTTPQPYYYSTPVNVGGTGSAAPSSFASTTNYASNQVTSKPGLTVSTVQTPISGVLINNQQAGFVEKFSGLRNPSSYNHVTGYHY